MDKNRIYYGAQDLMEMLGISRAKAYQMIKKMNSDLAEEGYIVVQGKVSRAYFEEKWYGLAQN